MDHSAQRGDCGSGSGIRPPYVLGWMGLFFGVVAGVVLVVSLSFPPEAIAAGEPWRSLGFEFSSCSGCALCGLSRAFAAVSHGEPLAGIGFNPLVALAWPTVVGLAVGGPIAFVRRHRSS